MKSQFTSSTSELIVTVLITGFLCWNIYVLATTGKMLALLPITIQSVLAFLLFTRNRYLSIGLKMWAVFFITAGVLKLLGEVMQSLSRDIDVEEIIWSSIEVIIGTIIWIVSSKEIIIVKKANESETLDQDL